MLAAPFDRPDGENGAEVLQRVHDGIRREAEGVEPFRVDTEHQFVVRIPPDIDVAELFVTAECALELVGAVKQRFHGNLAGDGDKRERDRLFVNLRHRFVHIRRQVAFGLRKDVLDLVEDVNIVRTGFDVRQDTEGAVLDRRRDHVQLTDVTQLVLDRRDDHFVQDVGAGPRITARNGDLVHLHRGEDLLGDVEVGEDGEQQDEQQQHVIEQRLVQCELDQASDQCISSVKRVSSTWFLNFIASTRRLMTRFSSLRVSYSRCSTAMSRLL